MDVDPTQVIVALTVLIGTIVTGVLMRRGSKETAAQQEDATALAERVQGFDEIESALTRAREEIRELRQFRAEDRASAAADIEHERAISRHERDRAANLGRQLHEATEALALLQRAVYDEAMKAAAKLALQHLADTADDVND